MLLQPTHYLDHSALAPLLCKQCGFIETDRKPAVFDTLIFLLWLWPYSALVNQTRGKSWTQTAGTTAPTEGLTFRNITSDLQIYNHSTSWNPFANESLMITCVWLNCHIVHTQAGSHKDSHKSCSSLFVEVSWCFDMGCDLWGFFQSRRRQDRIKL